MAKTAQTGWIGLFVAILGVGGAVAEPQHGIAMYGAPALEKGFASLPYANPDAPKGGTLVIGEGGGADGGFDSLNPYILKGNAPWGVRTHVVEALMGRSWDEPFTLYGLLAETIETAPDRSWVEFHLRPEARFSDGTPVTIEDVIWSFETLAAEGHPRYANTWDKVGAVTPVGTRGVRFSFTAPDNELPLIMGLRPILKKADWSNRAFGESSLDPVTGSGPYVIGDFEPGRFIEFERNPDYWGQDLAFNQGQHNFDTLRYEFFSDNSVIFEAFKAGEISYFREGNPARWARDYGFPAATAGDVVKAEIPHQRPSGMAGFVFNTRREIFTDWRVREAMILAFNFEFVNQAVNDSAYPRRTSYFANSELGMRPGPAEGAVAALLAPFADTLHPDTLTGYALPTASVDGPNRRNLRQARQLLEEAGWQVDDAGVLRNSAGQAFEVTVMLRFTRNESIASMYAEMLRPLGITLNTELVDSAQHNARKQAYDYDMMVNSWYLSLSPGNEQRLYWGAEGVTKPGTRNYMGQANPAVDALIDAMLTAEDRDGFVAAIRALDRVLMAGRYVVPFWYSDESLLAHRATLRYPDTLPIYGDWQGFLPDVWWSVD